MTLLLVGLGCHTLVKQDFAADAPAACGSPIYVPPYGYGATPHEFADADEAAYGAEWQPYHVRLSWSGPPTEEATILWRTDEDTFASEVQYGEDATYGSGSVGASFTFLVGESRVHEVRLCGLSPDTEYHYRVGGPDHWSADYSFRTAPPAGADVPVVIGLAGDARDNQATWAALLAAMEAKSPDFVIFSGDAVDYGGDQTEWDAWLDAGVGYMESHAFVMVHGNHELYAQNFFGFVAQPGNEQTFSLDYGPLHLAVLDDSTNSADREALGAWLDGDLAQTAQPWRFVSHHKPAYSSCTTHGSDEELQALWSPVEEAHGVQLDLTGHNHNYERSVPLRGGLEVAPGKGTVYVVSAGAGADLYANDGLNAFTATATSVEHYVLLTVDGDEVTGVAYDLAGNEIDRFTVPRGGS